MGLGASITRQNAEELFLLERFPVVGAVVSVPGILLSLVRSISKVGQAAISAIDLRRGKVYNHNVRTHNAHTNKLQQDAKDWALILLNQIINLSTAGLLNNIIVNLALHRIGNLALHRIGKDMRAANL